MALAGQKQQVGRVSPSSEPPDGTKERKLHLHVNCTCAMPPTVHCLKMVSR